MSLNFVKIFTVACRQRKQNQGDSAIALFLAEEYDDLSKRVDRSQIQESASIRGNLRARKLATLLFNSEGKLDLEKVKEALNQAKEHTHFIGPDREEDSLRQIHTIRALEYLLGSPATQKLIMQFSKPQAHPGAEKVIRETLDYPEHKVLSDLDVRIGALSAWLCYLRQSVGSCFATAPAILIQMEQPDQMLLDLKDLMETGRLKRVALGEEIFAPLSASWGVGDFKKPLILESGNEKSFREVGLSPGLMSGFEAVGLVDSNLSLKERVEATIEWVTKGLRQLDKGHLYFHTTPEEIFKVVFLDHFGLTEKSYIEWLKRPREMVFDNLMMTMSHADRGQRGLGAKGAQMMQAMETAKSAFMRLQENALLKTWEFTTASFAETKGEFSTWNLYVSLGLDPKEPEGIGYALYQEVSERLERANRKVEEYQIEYEGLYSHLKYTESKVKSAASEKELRWLRADYQAKLNEFNTFEEMRNKEHYRAKRMASLFSDLSERYISLFPRYFQEVYDAEVHEVLGGLWDDRPAGFRLLFKHGRMNTAQWTRVDSPEAFSQALASFFSLTESELCHVDEFHGLEQDISSMVTRVIQHVKTKEFLESALWRILKKNNKPLIKDPLDHLDLIEKKPWAYTSGGSLINLVSSYFKLKERPKEVDRFVDNEIELFVFLADTLKQLPYEITDRYKKDPYRRMLMHSPTHAFNLMPGLVPFQKTWEEDKFTYTAIRDQFVYPAQHYWEGYVVSQEEFKALVQLVEGEVPDNFKPGFKSVFANFPGEMSPPDLAEYIFDRMETEPSLKMRGNTIVSKSRLDTLFFESLPFISSEEIKRKGKEVFKEFPGIKSLWNEVEKELREGFTSAKELMELILSLWVSSTGKTSSARDLKAYLAKAMREVKWLPPEPLLFADTNWARFFFAMLVNPGSGQFELWRVDRLGLKGSPMDEWKCWLDGSKREPKWGVLPEPHQYKM